MRGIKRHTPGIPLPFVVVLAVVIVVVSVSRPLPASPIRPDAHGRRQSIGQPLDGDSLYELLPPLISSLRRLAKGHCGFVQSFPFNSAFLVAERELTAVSPVCIFIDYSHEKSTDWGWVQDHIRRC